MRNKNLLITVIVVMTAGVLLLRCGDDDVKITGPGPNTLDVLFIGNSYTSSNDMPYSLEYMTNEAGASPRINTAAVTIGGASLKNLWDDGTALAIIRDYDWDYVVLQEGTAVPFLDLPMMNEYTGKFIEAVRSSGAEPMLFLTWANRNSPDMLNTLIDAYYDIGDSLTVPVAPVGLAWQVVRDSVDALWLHSFDEAHPNRYGSYLTACVFYGVLYDSSPLGLTSTIKSNFGVVNIADSVFTAFFQNMAWKTVQTYGTVRP